MQMSAYMGYFFLTMGGAAEVNTREKVFCQLDVNLVILIKRTSDCKHSQQPETCFQLSSNMQCRMSPLNLKVMGLPRTKPANSAMNY